MNEQDAGQPDETLTRSAERSRAAWRRVWLRLTSVTPKQLIRFGLVVTLLAAVGWLFSQGWFPLLPLLVGAVIAYALLPLVNRLDRSMPRFLAVVFALLPVIGLGALFF